ncbi:MAG: mercury methylation ferredoxin HgcB [Elusimicrobiales bacterium]|nr:mercury methylation ferredoxin HgcB [Elusimicrobiales bacterium]
MTMKYLPGVSTLKLEAAKCIGCGMCAKVCPHAVFRIEARKAVITDVDLCMECGACAGNCPTEALSVKKGVGCAQAVRMGFLRGTEPDCGCGDDSSCC